MPILWLPRLRLPEPGVSRATGLLIPELRTTDQLGPGLKLPYFIRLGDHRDLTVTPYLAPESATLEARYRQAYLRGEIEVSGAVTRDSLVGGTRGYFFADGAFHLAGGTRLRFDIETASDDAYLLDYGIDDSDRLDSEISLSRITDREMRRARLTVYQSLRAAEDNDRLPPVVAEARGERRTTPAIGGTLSYGAGVQGHLRTLDAGPDGLGDALRAGVWADWYRARVTGPGLVVETRTGLRLDHYAFSPDASARDTTRATAQAAVTLRYPLIRQGPRAAHVLEPVAHLAWSDTTGGTVPNEDSITAEFDAASLFALSRFPGEDATETGPRAALGLSWARRGQAGWNSRLTFGRVLRGTENPAFTRTSGLDGTASDWLVAGALDTGTGLGLRGRALIDDDIAVTRAEALLDWRTDRLNLAAGYIFLPKMPTKTAPTRCARSRSTAAIASTTAGRRGSTCGTIWPTAGPRPPGLSWAGATNASLWIFRCRAASRLRLRCNRQPISAWSWGWTAFPRGAPGTGPPEAARTETQTKAKRFRCVPFRSCSPFSFPSPCPRRRSSRRRSR